MAVTRVNVSIPQGVWTDLYAASGIVVGTEVTIYQKTSLQVKIAASALAPTTVEGITLNSPTDPSDPVAIPPGEPGLWAFCANGTAVILVQEQAIQRHSFGSSLITSIHQKGMDFDTAAGLGMIPGVRRVTALGNNPDIDQGTIPEDVWSVGGLYPWMTVSTALEIISTSVNDTAAGTGARTVLIQGLDANYLEVNQTVTLNGTTAVAIPTSLLRVNSALIMSAGSTGINAGDINIRRVTGGTIQCQIPVGYGISRMAIFTVPAGNTLSVHSILFAQTKTGGVERNVTVSNFIQSPNGFYRMPLEISVGQGTPYRHEGKPGITLAEKTDFAFRVNAASSNDVSLTVAFLGTMYLNTTLALV